uniref:Transmembrane protein n=1 Tax=Rodentolepis nana TaxID=102285 RepID=A0A158QJF4_RODNA
LNTLVNHRRLRLAITESWKVVGAPIHCFCSPLLLLLLLLILLLRYLLILQQRMPIHNQSWVTLLQVDLNHSISGMYRQRGNGEGGGRLLTLEGRIGGIWIHRGR